MKLNMLNFEETAGGGTHLEETDAKDIAVIGMAARLPMADSIDDFWSKLSAGEDFISAFPGSRKEDADRFADLVGVPGKNREYNNGAYFEKIDTFDYSFFKISPKEAGLMSPDQKIFLETVWQAIEDAGYGNNKLRGSNTGVFAGYTADALFDYKRLIEKVDPLLLIDALPGNLSSVIPGRISYLFDLRGPSLCIDTACSSSLAAIHLACRALQNGECEMAIAGSVRLNLLPLKISKKLGIESSDGRARSFDDSSDGTGMGEGSAAVILKPLAKAQRDRDRIYGVVKGSALNQDGNSIGLTAPNAAAQEEVILAAWEDSGIDPGTISYIEAHGTGTKLGDPIEIEGITRAFRKYTDKKQFCAVGSVKTNLGHLDCAAGITGFIKALLSLKNRQIPASLHFKKPNREIDFASSPVYVNTALTGWDSEFPRRCGVSAFGLSGTNCHIVLEEAPEKTAGPGTHEEAREKEHILVLSAGSDASLSRLIETYHSFLSQNRKLSLDDLCYTAGTGRNHHSLRLAFLFKKRGQLLEALNKVIEEGAASSLEQGIFSSADCKTPGTGSGPDSLQGLCEAYTAGFDIDWDRLYRDRDCSKTGLPLYPFEKKRCWLDLPVKTAGSRIDRLARLLENNPAVLEKMEELLEDKNLITGQEKAENREITLTGREEGVYGDTERVLASLWGWALGYDSININADFYELGGDSIIALRICNEYEKQTGKMLETSSLFEYATVSSLAAFLENPAYEAKSADLSGISRGEQQDRYPLSSAQKRLYILEQFENVRTSYNMPVAISITGQLDRSRLKKALEEIVRRHEAFRTSFFMDRDTPYQKVHEKVDFTVETTECPDETKLSDLLTSFIRPFDLEKAPLIRAHIVVLDETRHILFLDAHHIITDGISSVIFDRELLDLYCGKELEKPALHYADYAVWEQKRLDREELQKQEDYWLGQFARELPVLRLPTDFPRPRVQSFEGDRFLFEAGPELTAKITDLAETTGTTLYMVLMSVYTMLLAKYTGQEDIIVASPLSARKRQELENVIGMFASTIALRTNPAREKSFLNYLQEIKTKTLEAHANSDYPFENLLEKLDLDRDISRNPLFDTMLTLQNTAKLDIKLADLHFSQADFDNRSAKFDLNLNISHREGTIKFDLEYSTKLFKKETIARMAGHLLTLFASVTRQPGAPLGRLSMLPAREYRQLVTGFNPSGTLDRPGLCMHQLISENAARFPGRTAVEWGNRSLTYAMLERKTSALAKILREKGVGKDTLAAVKTGRSLELVIAIVAVLKAGGAYVPIDPLNPDERIRFILEDSRTRVVLTDAGSLEDMQKLSSTAEVLDLEDPGLYAGQSLEPDFSCSPGDLAYMIYTSGSTGKPKGVLVEHGSLINFVYALKETFNNKMDENDRCLSLTSISFDVSVCEIFFPLAFGAALVLYDQPAVSDAGHLAETVTGKKISFSYFPPALLAPLALELAAAGEPLVLDKMLVGVEAIKDSTLEAFIELNKEMQIINGYGPTEATICATFFPYKPGNPKNENVPIGKPLAGTGIYIIDQSGNPLPVGVPGELCISGAGVTRGYLNRPELTAEKFVSCPFAQNSLMYRTGDRALWLESGDILFAGRIDNQVKIRGYRIEPGEIESALSHIEEIKEAVVLARENSTGNKQLVAYLVSEHKIDVQEIKKRLSRSLPDYMVPSLFVSLEKMPLTANGKIDRKALPERSDNLETGREYAAPQNETEQKLAEIWSSLLGVEKVGIHDNFFELGGDSIITIRVVSKAKELGISLTPKDLFQYQTIAELAKVNNTNTLEITAQQGMVSGEIPLTPIQAWFFEENFEQKNHWNQAVMLRLKETLSAEIIQKAIDALVKQHDVLRLRCLFENETVIQIHADSVSYPLEVVDYSHLPGETLARQIEEYATKTQGELSLEKGIVLKAVLFKTETGNTLLIVIHHLVVDGVSWRIIIEDIEKALSQQVNKKPIELGPKTSSYKQWSEGLTGYAQSDKAAAELPFWTEMIDKPRTFLPLDYKGENSGSSAENVRVKLPGELTSRLLKETGGAYKTEINDVLLTALALCLEGWTGNRSITINLEGHGREELFADTDISRTAGWFTTQYPVCLTLPDSDDIADCLKSIKEQLRAIPGKGIGYGILKYLCCAPSGKTEPALHSRQEVSFNYLGQFDAVGQSSSLVSLSELQAGLSVSKENHRPFILDINGLVSKGELVIDWTYSKNLHDRNTIETAANNYINTLQTIIEQYLKPELKEYTSQELAAYSNKKTGIYIPQGPVEGETKLLPILKGFLERVESSSNFINAALMIYKQDGFEKNRIEKAVKKITEHHDALRAVFHFEKEKTTQYNRGTGGKHYELKIFDLKDEPDYRQRIEKEAETLHKSIDIEKGPLFKLGLFHTSKGDHLLFVTTHLVCDAMSLSIIIEDFIAVYEYSKSSGAIQLPAKTTSLQDYGKLISEYSESNELLNELDYWYKIDKSRVAPLPCDRTVEKRVSKYGQSLPAVMTEEETRALLKSSRTYDMNINELLLAGMWLAIRRWSGLEEIQVTLTGNGRTGLMENIDLTRTVGWLAISYPAYLSTDKTGNYRNEIEACIEAVKKNSRNLPKNGMGYDILKYSTSDTQKGNKILTLQPILFFNFFGMVNTQISEDKVFQLSPLPCGALHAEDNPSIFALEFFIGIIDGILNINLGYNSAEYDASTIQKLLDTYKKSLTDIITSADQTSLLKK